MFCDKCGSILLPAKIAGKTRLKCPRCKFSTSLGKNGKITLKEEIKQKKEDQIEVVEKKIETLPKIKEECPKCHFHEAYYWDVQTRSADEAPTQFFKCTKCMHTWRKY